MFSRNILVAVAAGALAVTPVLAQQPTPKQVAASVSRDSTHTTKRAAHKKTAKPKHKAVKHNSKVTKKTAADSTKKS